MAPESKMPEQRQKEMWKYQDLKKKKKSELRGVDASCNKL